MSKLMGTLDPTTRAMFEVLLSKWAKPGMNNPDDELSSKGSSDDEGINHDVLREAASRDAWTQNQQPRRLPRPAEGGRRRRALRAHAPRAAPALIVSITESQRERAGIGHTATGTDLPMSEIITLAAQAQMYLAVFDDHTGEALYLARAKRLASESQRILAFATYGGCSKPGCPAPFSHTEMHHAEQDWPRAARRTRPTLHRPADPTTAPSTTAPAAGRPRRSTTDPTAVDTAGSPTHRRPTEDQSSPPTRTHPRRPRTTRPRVVRHRAQTRTDPRRPSRDGKGGGAAGIGRA